MQEYNDIPWQVRQYEELSKKMASVYFDVDDFEEILDYYLFRGFYKEAFEVTKCACGVHPASIPLMLKKAQLLATFNQEDDALKLLARIESLDPTNNDIFLTKGAIYSQLHDYNKAIEEYNKAVFGADEPDYVYCNIAFEYENLGNFDKTIEYLDKALKLNPDNDLAIYEAAYCFDLLSLTEESISFFRRLIDRNPYSTEAWFNLGVSYINAGLYEKALEALEYSIAIDDDHEHSWFHKGYTLSLLNRHREAIGAYEESMSDGIVDAMKLYYIGECYEKLEDYDNAIDYYIQCTKNDPEMADAWIGIGVCEIETGKPAEAIKYLEQGIRLDHGNVGFLCLLANTFFLNNEKEKAKTTYDEALQADLSDEETWLEYAEALVNMEEHNNAINLLNKALNTLPNHENILYTLAAVHFLVGNTTEGSFFLFEAYSIDEGGIEAILERFSALKNNNDFLHAVDCLHY